MSKFIRMTEADFNRLYYKKNLTHFTTVPERYEINHEFEIIIDVDNTFLFQRTGMVCRLNLITKNDGLSDMSCLFLEVVKMPGEIGKYRCC